MASSSSSPVFNSTVSGRFAGFSFPFPPAAAAESIFEEKLKEILEAPVVPKRLFVEEPLVVVAAAAEDEADPKPPSPRVEVLLPLAPVNDEVPNPDVDEEEPNPPLTPAKPPTVPLPKPEFPLVPDAAPKPKTLFSAGLVLFSSVVVLLSVAVAVNDVEAKGLAAVNVAEAKGLLVLVALVLVEVAERLVEANGLLLVVEEAASPDFATGLSSVADAVLVPFVGAPVGTDNGRFTL
mmetsp:Transcript_2769/g.5948  ORF Transcript_2769/g.5948 Transcript_2769/m.5948 type:complete len:236 (+) Transcript_2769:974-1681(+)